MFNVSSTGGAYGDGEYGAVARLYSWESLHAMTAKDSFVSNQETYAQIQDFDWYDFFMDKWFEYVAWDFGLLAINRKTNDFVFIAATDTD